ncbi:MAG: bifunctional SulP family inorganic anion transporter/carbonic anhydrase [Planctomycetales bacterium]|nr:bifunctional SulP family inorganic anion transporter/carbonic anhydrase [Planctomycetales bacterium]
MNKTTLNAQNPSVFSTRDLGRDITAGLVVFLVALPLCLGIALASGADPMSGLLSGIVGGLVVGMISGSHTSVSGPAAGLTAIVAAEIGKLGTFEAFLLAVVVAGVLQVLLGVLRAGALSAFFPSSVIKGLLAAIGVILILKQIPHLLGHDTDPEGEMSYVQPDGENPFSELQRLFQGEIHSGAMAIGISCLILLILWNRSKTLKGLVIPGPLVVVLAGVAMKLGFDHFLTDSAWLVEASHLVQVPVAGSANEFFGFLRTPHFSQWLNPAIYYAGVTMAIVASLETLLNLEAVDKLDTLKRQSPANRELIAQGAGNIVAGLIGGLPVTSVIVRSSVNVGAGGRTKRAAIFHGILLVVCVALFPVYLNLIPLSALAAILIVTGFKLASPQLFRQMWSEGRYQFLPFIITLVAIVRTDLLIGIVVGLCVAIVFILRSNLRSPIRRIVETHLDGDVTHIELANQVSFLNRAGLVRIFHDAQPGAKILVDATGTDYIDPDVLGLIREFKEETAPSRGVQISLRGFKKKYQLQDDVVFADYSTRELQDKLTPDQVLDILKEGNRRFRLGERLSRDFGRQVDATSAGQNPLAVVLSCIDSRVPVELVLDLGLGDVFSVRVAGNVIGTKSLASMEYGVGVAGSKLILVLGHTKCGAVTAAVDLLCKNLDAKTVTGCDHLQSIVNEIAPSVAEETCQLLSVETNGQMEAVVDEVAKRNVLTTVAEITQRSAIIRKAVEEGRAKVVGAMYDVRSGEIEFFDNAEFGRHESSRS